MSQYFVFVSGGVQGKRVSQPQVYFYSVIAYNEVFSFFFTIDDYFGDNFAFSFTIGGVTIEGNSALLEEGLLKNTRLADQSLFKTQLPGGWFPLSLIVLPHLTEPQPGPL